MVLKVDGERVPLRHGMGGIDIFDLDKGEDTIVVSIRAMDAMARQQPSGWHNEKRRADL
jgi:hypothetical protein